MQIYKPEHVSITQLSDMQKLSAVCNRHDNTAATVDIDESFRKADEINTFLLYENEELISLINLFTPTISEAELVAFTHPAQRRKGLFSMLLTEAKAEILKRGINDFLFVSERDSDDGQAVCRRMGADYEFSEYLMRYVNENEMITRSNPSLKFRRSLPDDTDQLIELAIISNDESKEEAEHYIKSIFSSANRIQHVAILNGRIVGMITSAIEQQTSYIHGLSVFPDYRKRGIGRDLLEFKTSESIRLHPQNEIVLEVMTENMAALSIYKRAGFVITTCFDYLRLSSDKII